MPPTQRYEPIAGDELYRRLAMGRSIVILDVRTATEFEQRHIPGSLLIPLQDLDSRLHEIPNNGTPIAVVSERGMRSSSGCGFLAERGFRPLFDLGVGLGGWPGPLADGLEHENVCPHGICPSSFLVENFDLLPPGLALDVAMGEGRNAIYLATRGFDVDGVDSDLHATARARVAARKLGAPIRAIVGNFEDGTYRIAPTTYDLIIVFNYLYRPMVAEIRAGVRPGGMVMFQTFTGERGHHAEPSDAERLLQPGELDRLFAGWEILERREVVGPSRRDGRVRAVAGILGRKPDEAP